MEPQMERLLGQLMMPQPEVEYTAFIDGPHFFAALVAGVILALAFQLMLTMLSMAAGLNVLGTIGGNGSSDKGAPNTPPDEGHSHIGRTMTTAYGAWALVTTSLALFFAALLGTMLSLTGSAAIATVLALTIWGAFFLILASIEWLAISSLAGTLISVAGSGLRSLYRSAGTLFTKSPEKRIADAAVHVADEVRHEVFGDVDTHRMRKQLEEYLRDFRHAYDPREVRKQLEKLLDHVELRAITDAEGPLAHDHEHLVTTIQAGNPGMSKEDAQKAAHGVRSALQQIREEYNSDKDAASSSMDAALRVSGYSPAEAEATREKLEGYLRNTGREELDPEGIHQDITKLFEDRDEGIYALMDRLSKMDRETLVALLAQREDMDEEQARKQVDRVEKGLNMVMDWARQRRSKSAGGPSMKPQSSASTDDIKAASAGANDKLRDYLNSLGRPELRYEALRSDLHMLLNDPRAGADALLRRLKSLDRNTLIAIMSSRSDVSPADAEATIAHVEEVRDEYIAKAEHMKEEVERRLAKARDEALHQADEARKVAAMAAWWGFGAAVVSGVAAVIGGLVGVAIIG